MNIYGGEIRDNIHEILIDESNERCIDFISIFPFDEIDNSRFTNKEDLSRPPRVFECPLSTIRFS